MKAEEERQYREESIRELTHRMREKEREKFLASQTELMSHQRTGTMAIPLDRADPSSLLTTSASRGSRGGTPFEFGTPY